MSENKRGMARQPLGRNVNGALVVSEDELFRAKADLRQFNNVFPGRGVEHVTLGESLKFDVAVALARDVAAVVIIKRDYRTPPGIYGAAGLVGSVVGAVKAAQTMGKASERLDVAPIKPEDVQWADDGTAIVTVLGSVWHLSLGPIGQCCVRAWQARTFDEYKYRAQAVGQIADPLLALLVHAVATETDPRSFLSWNPPYESVIVEIGKHLSDAEGFQDLCATGDDVDFGKDFCQNLARLPVPGAAKAAAAIAQKFNERSRIESVVFAAIGAAVAIIGYVRFQPFATRSFWGWAMLIGGLLLLCYSAYGLFSDHVSIPTPPADVPPDDRPEGDRGDKAN